MVSISVEADGIVLQCDRINNYNVVSSPLLAYVAAPVHFDLACVQPVVRRRFRVDVEIP